MKHLKSILALVVAAITALALSTAAFATEPEGGAADPVTTGSITIDNAVVGKDYTIYEILVLDDHNSDYSAITYKIAPKWDNFFVNGSGTDYVDIDDQGYVTWKDGASAVDFAAASIEFAEENGIEPDGTATAASGTVEFTGLDLGYYLVKSSLGALCSLDTTMPNVTIKEKNAEPTLDKQVKESPAGTWGKTNDANVGDTVEFKIDVEVIDGQPKDYVIYDTLSAGLSLNADSVAVKVNGAALPTTSYTYAYDTESEQNTFNIAFGEGVLKANDKIEVTYTATINSKAVIGTEGNPNEAHLEYTTSTGTKGETTPSKTRTFAWQIDAHKYTVKDGAPDTPLEGAQFILSRVNGETTEYVQVDANSKVTGWTADETAASVFTTPADGNFSIFGLDAGSYLLTETQAPAGYNTLKDPIAITITSVRNDAELSATYEVTYGEASTGTVNIENKTGKELPSTGGMGTTVFYIVGGILVAFAAVVLVTRARMAGKDGK